MTKTYIYGVPHGFDFYEKDVEFNDYFKGFYISSRRGRRLMINRRDNGETIYSYLRYGLKEIDRQPLHSFFGMSLVIDDYKFCPNFKVLLEWFDYLFNKLVNEHNIIEINDDGVYHYIINKFDENPEDIKWLKNNLPNILKPGGQTQIMAYDQSFADGKAGQVVSFNQPVGENRLLETFKKYRWISVSAEILEKEELTVSDGFTDPGTIELNYEELNKKYNEYNQQLLPIAIDISKASHADLKQMSDEVKDICTSFVKYLPSIEEEKKEEFRALGTKYDSLKGSIATLLSKIVPEPKPLPKTQYCFSCKQNKPLNHFRSVDATKCIECEKRDNPPVPVYAYKTCIRCGKKKPAKFFNQPGTDICDDCLKPEKGSKWDEIFKVLKTKGVVSALLGLLVIGGITLAIINLPKNDELKHRPDIDKSEEVAVLNDKKVDKKRFDQLIDSCDFKALYECVRDKEDANNYKQQIRIAIDDFLWKIVDSPSQSKYSPKDKIDEFFIINNELLEFIGFGENDKSSWADIVNDYTVLWNILTKKEVTDTDLKMGSAILSKHGDIFPQEFRDMLNNKPKVDNNSKDGTSTGNANGEKAEPADTTPKYTLTYTSAYKSNEESVDIDKGKIGFDGKVGTLVTVTCKNGKILENNKTKITIELKEVDKSYTIKLNKDLVITITAKKGLFN